MNTKTKERIACYTGEYVSKIKHDDNKQLELYLAAGELYQSVKAAGLHPGAFFQTVCYYMEMPAEQEDRGNKRKTDKTVRPKAQNYSQSAASAYKPQMKQNISKIDPEPKPKAITDPDELQAKMEEYRREQTAMRKELAKLREERSKAVTPQTHPLENNHKQTAKLSSFPPDDAIMDKEKLEQPQNLPSRTSLKQVSTKPAGRNQSSVNLPLSDSDAEDDPLADVEILEDEDNTNGLTFINILPDE